MTNWKAFVGIMWFFILCQLICNIWGGRDIYEDVAPYPISQNNADNSSMYLADQTIDSLGTSTSVPAFNIVKIIDFLNKLFFFDYPVFENDDGTDNDFIIIRWMLICIGIIMWIELFLLLRRMTVGG